MIEIKANVGPVSYKAVWFADRPERFDGFGLTAYRQSTYRRSCLGFVRTIFHTKLIDLTRSAGDLLAACGRNTVYKINRASREGIEFGIEEDVGAFAGFYNRFAEIERLPRLGRRFFEAHRLLVRVTKAIHGPDTLIMHCYLCDRLAGRVRLLHSAPAVGTMQADGGTQAVRGRANRFLHYRDMLYFQEEGFEIYDLGGYAYGTTDEKLIGINRFKDGFGGILVEESDFMSYPLYGARVLTGRGGRITRS